MSKLSALSTVNTSFGSTSHTALFHCSSAIAVTNLSCVSVDDTVPNWFSNLIKSLDPPCISTASANKMCSGVGLLNWYNIISVGTYKI